MNNITNFYFCCNKEWEVDNCCSYHNDKCPKCNCEIEPYKSLNFTLEGEQWVYHEKEKEYIDVTNVLEEEHVEDSGIKKYEETLRVNSNVWTYEGLAVKDHSDLLEGCTDIVYIINYTNGQKYIGKKTVRSIRRLKPTKKQLAIRKNYVRKELKDLPFINYEGSSELTSELTIKSKEILYQCKTKKAATYLESAELFGTNAIFEDEYVNKNIQGRFFGNDLVGLL